jgi:hypothetical protein
MERPGIAVDTLHEDASAVHTSGQPLVIGSVICCAGTKPAAADVDAGLDRVVDHPLERAR